MGETANRKKITILGINFHSGKMILYSERIMRIDWKRIQLCYDPRIILYLYSNLTFISGKFSFAQEMNKILIILENKILL